VTDDDDFDPTVAASLASGDEPDAGADMGADPQTSTPNPGGDSDEDVVDVGSIATAYLAPLLTAPERGPTASTLQERGLDERSAQLLDGVIDYILEVAGIEVGDHLGPAGKIALALGTARDRATGDDQDDVDDDLGSNAGGNLSGEAREIVGEVDGAS